MKRGGSSGSGLMVHQIVYSMGGSGLMVHRGGGSGLMVHPNKMMVLALWFTLIEPSRSNRAWQSNRIDGGKRGDEND